MYMAEVWRGNVAQVWRVLSEYKAQHKLINITLYHRHIKSELIIFSTLCWCVVDCITCCNLILYIMIDRNSF